MITLLGVTRMIKPTCIGVILDVAFSVYVCACWTYYASNMCVHKINMCLYLFKWQEGIEYHIQLHAYVHIVVACMSICVTRFSIHTHFLHVHLYVCTDICTSTQHYTTTLISLVVL